MNKEQQPQSQLRVKRKLFGSEDNSNPLSEIQVNNGNSSNSSLSVQPSSQISFSLSEKSQFQQNRTSPTKFFVGSIQQEFEGAMKPVSAFYEKILEIEGNYKHLLQSLGQNFDQYSYNYPAIAEIENIDPALARDSSMDMVSENLNTFGFEMRRLSEWCFTQFLSSSNTLRRIVEKLQSKIENLKAAGGNPLYIKPLSIMEEKCLAIISSMHSQMNLINKYLDNISGIVKVLERTQLLDTDMKQEVNIRERIYKRLMKECHYTSDQANTFLLQEKTKKFVEMLVGIKAKNETDDSDLISLPLNGLIKSVQQIQQHKKASAALRRIR